MVKQRKLNTPEKRARVGERIKVAATQAGISLKDLAEQASVSPSAIYQYVRRITAVPSAVLDRIAAITQIHPSFFDPDLNARATLALPAETSEQIHQAIGAAPGVPSRLDIEYRHEQALSDAQRGAYASRETLLAGLERLLALARAMENRGHHANALLKMGAFQLESGDARAGESLFSEARDLAGSDLLEIRAQAILGLAACLSAQGETSNAIRLLESLAADPSGEIQWKTELLMGKIHTQRGDLGTAFMHFGRSADTARPMESPQTIRDATLALSTALATLAYRAGHFEAARMLWKQVAHRAERDHDPHTFMTAVTEVGRCDLATGDLISSRVALERVLVLSAFWPAAERRDTLARSLFAEVQAALGDGVTARESARIAVRTAHRIGCNEAVIASELAMARVRLASEQYAEAAEHAAEALTRARAASSPALIAECRAIRAIAGIGEQSAKHDATTETRDQSLQRARQEATAACDAARSSGDKTAALQAQWALAETYYATGLFTDAESATADLLSMIDHGPAQFLAQPAAEIANLADLLAPEVDLQALFRPDARLDAPLLEWQVHTLRGVLAESRNEPDRAFASFLTAAEIVSRTVSRLTPSEARRFQQHNPRLMTLASGLERSAPAAEHSTEAHVSLESLLHSNEASGMAVVSALVKSVVTPVL